MSTPSKPSRAIAVLQRSWPFRASRANTELLPTATTAPSARTGPFGPTLVSNANEAQIRFPVRASSATTVEFVVWR
jgi:hypothetical protein